MSAADADDLRPRVRALQAELATLVFRCRLLARETSEPDARTWMEIYEDVPAGFEDVLAAALRRHAIAERVAERHVERFTEQPD